MIIRNFNELATAFETTPNRIASILSCIAHADLSVDNSPTCVRISHLVGECNAELSCSFRYPFDSVAVSAFIESLEPAIANLLDIYDDPFDMLMNTTNPGEAWTIEDAGRCLSEAEANGWKFSDTVDPQYILDLYNSMDGDE